jgi:hypothetical protein
MNAKPNNPDEMVIIHKEFSWRTAWTVNYWLFLATITSLVCDVIFAEAKNHWLLRSRLAILLAEFLGVVLWTRSMARWIAGMDELHRRITQMTLLFAVSAAFAFFFLWLRLEREGFFHAVFGPPFMNNTWGINSLFHIYVLVSAFYGIGYLFFSRRYK